MKDGLNLFLRAVGVSLLFVVNPVGTSRRGSPVSEIERVASVYSEKERAQIEDFGKNAELVMYARMLGERRCLDRVVGEMLKRYAVMSPAVRGEVGYDVETVRIFLDGAYGCDVADEFIYRVCDIETDDF